MASNSLSWLMLILVVFFDINTVHSQVTEVFLRPTFLAPDPFEFNVSEDEMPGYDVGKLNATRQYLLLPCFVIETQTDKFRMPDCRNVDNENILLIRKLDYEVQPTYTLRIKATNYFDDTLSRWKNLTINVINVNDNRPEFQNHWLLASIPENANVSYRLPNVINVTDADGNVNPQNLSVKCNVATSSDCEYFDLVQSNEINTQEWLGHLILKKKVPSIDKFVINLQATDGKLVANQLFHIPIKDINNHAPQFDKVQTTMYITEGVALGYFVSFIIVRDEDKAGLLTVKCNDDEPMLKESCKIFELVPITQTNRQWIGKLSLLENLDFETSKRQFLLQLLASDGKNTKKQNITIIVVDANDEVPKFVTTPKEWRINETAKVGTILDGVIEITDADINPEYSNITITCENTSTDKSHDACNTFVLGPLTRIEGTTTFRARLRLARNLDYETYQVYTMNFIASDGKFRSILQTKVYVDDVNDNQPSFAKPQYRSSLAMSTPLGTEIQTDIIARDTDRNNELLTVSCEDPDGEKKNTSESVCNTFEIKTIHRNDTYWLGRLVVKKLPPYNELQPTLYITLVANDGVSNSNPAIVAVTITPIPVYLSYMPVKPELHSNVKFTCSFVFPDGFNNTRVEILRTNATIIRYEPESRIFEVFRNQTSSSVTNVTDSQVIHHGSLSFMTQISSCFMNSITCQTMNSKGIYDSATQDLLSYKGKPEVEISRSNCINLKAGYTRLLCKAKSNKNTSILKWYLKNDGGSYIEAAGGEIKEVLPSYDNLRCSYMQSSIIVVNVQNKPKEVMCRLVDGENNDVILAQNTTKARLEVLPEKPTFIRSCKGIKNKAVETICYGNVGNPAAKLRMFIINETDDRLQEIDSQLISENENKYMEKTCNYFRSVSYMHENTRRTTRFMCLAATYTSNMTFDERNYLTIYPSDSCRNNQVTLKSQQPWILSLISLSLYLIVCHYKL